MEKRRTETNNLGSLILHRGKKKKGLDGWWRTKRQDKMRFSRTHPPSEKSRGTPKRNRMCFIDFPLTKFPDTSSTLCHSSYVFSLFHSLSYVGLEWRLSYPHCTTVKILRILCRSSDIVRREESLPFYLFLHFSTVVPLSPFQNVRGEVITLGRFPNIFVSDVTFSSILSFFSMRWMKYFTSKEILFTITRKTKIGSLKGCQDWSERNEESRLKKKSVGELYVTTLLHDNFFVDFPFTLNGRTLTGIMVRRVHVPNVSPKMFWTVMVLDAHVHTVYSLSVSQTRTQKWYTNMSTDTDTDIDRSVQVTTSRSGYIHF